MHFGTFLCNCTPPLPCSAVHSFSIAPHLSHALRYIPFHCTPPLHFVYGGSQLSKGRWAPITARLLQLLPPPGVAAQHNCTALNCAMSVGEEGLTITIDAATTHSLRVQYTNSQEAELTLDGLGVHKGTASPDLSLMAVLGFLCFLMALDLSWMSGLGEAQAGAASREAARGGI